MYKKYNGCKIGAHLDAGTYKGQIEPLSLAGPGALSAEFFVDIEEKPSKNQTVLYGALAGMSGLIVLLVIVGYFVARK